MSSARNAGLDVANGSYISFVDSDDFIESDSLKNMLEACKSSTVNVVCMRSIISDENDNVLYVQGSNTMACQPISWSDYIRGICHKKLSESVCDKLFNAKLLKKRRFESGRLNEDFFFLSKLLMDNTDVAVLDFNGYHYLKHSGTITSDKRNFVSLKDAIRNSCELAEYARCNAEDAYIHFVYSALFQSKVLLTNLPSDSIGSNDWQYGIETINCFSSKIKECGLSRQDQILIYGFRKFPRLTKLIYRFIK